MGVLQAKQRRNVHEGRDSRPDRWVWLPCRPSGHGGRVARDASHRQRRHVAAPAARVGPGGGLVRRFRRPGKTVYGIARSSSATARPAGWFRRACKTTTSSDGLTMGVAVLAIVLVWSTSFPAQRCRVGSSVQRGPDAGDQAIVSLPRAAQLKNARGQVAITPNRRDVVVVFQHRRAELVIVGVTAL